MAVLGPRKMEVRSVAAVLALVVCVSLAAEGKLPPDNRVENLELTSVSREVDLSSPLVKQKVTMVVENKASGAVTSVLYTVEPQLADKVAYVGAKVSEFCCI